MRLLVLVPALTPGGAERQLAILLPGLRPYGVEAAAVSLGASAPLLKDPLHAADVSVETLGMRFPLDAPALLRSRVLRRFDPDVILSTGVNGLYVGQLIARLRGAAHVFADHRGIGVAASPRQEWLEGRLAPRVDRVVVVSEDQRGRWEGYGCARERIVRIPNGVPDMTVPDAPAELRRELGVPRDSIVAVQVSTLKALKHVPDFIAGLARAQQDVPALAGLIAGDGPDRGEIEHAAARVRDVVVLGQRDDIARVLGASDVFVLPSEAEALPMSVLEAMAAGLPVLATRAGGIPELVEDGKTGLLFEPGDVAALARSLARLAGDGELRSAMGRASRKRWERSWSSAPMIERYLKLFTEVVAERKRRR